jgi:hypothetical protein
MLSSLLDSGPARTGGGGKPAPDSAGKEKDKKREARKEAVKGPVELANQLRTPSREVCRRTAGRPRSRAAVGARRRRSRHARLGCDRTGARSPRLASDAALAGRYARAGSMSPFTEACHPASGARDALAKVRAGGRPPCASWSPTPSPQGDDDWEKRFNEVPAVAIGGRRSADGQHACAGDRRRCGEQRRRSFIHRQVGGRTAQR